MSSKYHPQLFGWFGDLAKGPSYFSRLEEELIYVNQTSCIIRRISTQEKIITGILVSIILFLTILYIFIFLYFYIFIFLYFYIRYSLPLGKDFLILCILPTLLIFFNYCWTIPECFKVYFSPKDSPIVFNRKTKKVYINESEYFSFKIRFHPKYLLQPRKKNVKEYDWDDLHAVAISNFSKVSKNTIMLMACTPGTYDVETHIIFDHGRSGLLDLSRWGWVNNYMVDFDLFDEDGQSKLVNLAHYEQETKNADLSIYGWPEWMLAAFNAESLEHLAQIKQQYGVQ